jgi:hypothetical protein
MEGKPAIDPRQVGRNVVMTAAIAGLGGLLFGSLTFLSLIDGLGRGGAFLFYAAMCAFTFWFCRRYVPETKGKRLEEIQTVFEERVAAKATAVPEPVAP